MVGSIKSHTKNFKFIIPEFNVATWHDYIEENFRSIDALFQNLFGINGFSGMWKTNTAYEAGQVLFVGEDGGSIYEGRLVKVIQDTNTGGFATFSEAIEANPKDYEFFTDASSAQLFANLAKDWASKTGSTVKTPEGDDTGEYSAKHYQTLAKSNEEQCEMYKNLTDTNVQLTQEAVVSAETFAQNSETSAQNALVSEQNSKTSETNSKTSEQNAKISEQNAAKSLEDLGERIISIEGCVGDIGIAPFGIDETKNKRRYLNGQVISQTQFVAFTNLIKKRILTNPSIATTEENWQSEVSLSINGTCGKFVINDTTGTIRLPKYPEYCNKEYVEVASRGNGIAVGLTKGTEKNYGLTSIRNVGLDGNTSTYGSNIGTNISSGTGIGDTEVSIGITTDPTKSGIVTDFTHATSETIPCKWFIQVATGNEEQADITTEIQLNNPFSLLDYKWSEYELTNASWLLSNGAFHSGSTYPAVYDLLLKIYNGTETKQGVSVKLSTETYEDTDFVLNTAENTFRLPIKVKLASGSAVSGNGMTLGLTNGTQNAGLAGIDAGNTNTLFPNTAKHGSLVGESIQNNYATRNMTYGVTTDPTKSGIETSSQDLYLYFYVGETVQDANVIRAGYLLTKVANCIDRTSATDRALVSGLAMPSNYYIDLAIGSAGTPYTAPTNGFFGIIGKCEATSNISGYVEIQTSDKVPIAQISFSGYQWYHGGGLIPVSKGQILVIKQRESNTFITSLKFIYAEGEI